MEETNVQTNESTAMGAADYAKLLAEYKANSVSKADYDKLANDNAILAKAALSGVPNESSNEPKYTEEYANDLRRKLMTTVMSNREYVETACDLRDCLLAMGGDDPFLPNGKNYIASTEDANAAETTYDAFRKCLEVADGDDGVFNRELERIVVDTNPFATMAAKRRR